MKKSVCPKCSHESTHIGVRDDIGVDLILGCHDCHTAFRAKIVDGAIVEEAYDPCLNGKHQWKTIGTIPHVCNCPDCESSDIDILKCELCDELYEN